MSKRKFGDKGGPKANSNDPVPSGAGAESDAGKGLLGLEASSSHAQPPPSALIPLLKTIRHLFPDLASWLKSVHDRRNPQLVTYPIDFELWTVLFLFWSKLSARRQIYFQFNTPECVGTFNRLAGCRMKRMMAPDTLPYGLARIPLQDLTDIQYALVHRLLRQKVLTGARLFNRYYMIAIDMTGCQTFTEKHCDRCLSMKTEGKTIYWHAVLEAKLVTPSGMALSIVTEFVENAERSEAPTDRQDCEQRAFYRLARRLKKLLPQLKVCLLLDGLYAVQPVLDLCRELEFKYLITFKEGRARATFQEYERLAELGGDKRDVQGKYGTRKFGWLNGLPYGAHSVNVLECREPQGDGESKRFVWMTNLAIDKRSFVELGDEGGRQRWRVENEGFNMQKNGGYGLEHAYSEDEELMKRFDVLLQIAHTIYQLLEKGLLQKSIRKVFGSIRNVARRLLEEVRTIELSWDEIGSQLGKRIQIRLDTS